MFKIGYIASSIKRFVLGKLLDLYPNAAAAYSLRKLRDAYSGSAVRVRRSTDNTEQDIGFDGSGNLDETALTTFVGNGNAFLRSEEFDNAYWAKSGTTVLANQTTSPTGFLTADKLSETATIAIHYNYNNTGAIQFISGRYYTNSIYVKKGIGITSPDIVQLFLPAQAFTIDRYANFNITTGVVTANSSSTTATITDAGNGWWRCSVSALCTINFSIGVSFLTFCNNNPTSGAIPSYMGLTTSDVFVWGAQLNAGSVAQTYVATTANQAGFGYVTKWYDQGYTGSYNFFSYSEQFDNAYWTKSNVSVIANNTTDPLGGNTADKINTNTTNGFHGIETGSTFSWVLGKTYTISIYAKASEYNFLRMGFPSSAFSGGINAYFNLSTGILGTRNGGVSHSIISVGSGWYRCSFTATATSTTTSAITSSFYVSQSDNQAGYVGSITSGIFIWGAQINEGTSADAYIQTVASAVLARDVVQTTAANQPAIYIAGQVNKEGTKATLYFDGSNDRLDTNGVVVSQPNTTIVIGKQVVANAQRMIMDGITTRQYIQTNNSQYINMNGGADLASTTVWGTTNRLIFSLFNGASSTLSQNSISVASGNAGTNSLSGLKIGTSSSNTFFWHGLVTEAIIYPSNQTANQAPIQTDINTYYTIY